MISSKLCNCFNKAIYFKNVNNKIINKRHLLKSEPCSSHHYSTNVKSSESDYEEQTHFGYENVSKKEKAEKVHSVFENVASTYDLMNDLMSAGIHRLWKDYFVSCLNPTPHSKILDVAGGTGDIAFRIANSMKSVKKLSGNIDSEISNMHNITVCDISQNMLSVGEKRSIPLGYKNINWVVGDAQSLPFDDMSFDAYTIAYGIRNVVDIEKALDEAYRVLKPGGRFLCLEFSQVNSDVLRRLYDAYSFQMIPAIGLIVAGDWKSYQYLVESIRQFPDQKSFKELIENSGFRKVTYSNLTFGVTAIHSGFKI